MAEPAADIVILSQPGHQEVDPRSEGASVSARVVLHRPCSVIVEIQDGTDAIGQPHWLRLDGKKRLLRAAYVAVSGLLVSFYDRAIAAENRATAAEERARKAEAKARGGASMPALAPPDPKQDARVRVNKLLELAERGETIDERRNAALSAADIMRKNGISPK